MEKEKKEIQERNKHLEEWADKGNFDDWVNLGLEYDYLEKWNSATVYRFV